MFFKQFYLGCLAHASYLLGANGEAAVIDPQRDVEQYLREADAAGLKIKYIIETHLHADFVSGHRELAERTGAEIVFGAKAGATFQHRAVSEGDDLNVGSVRLRILETPGHTPESISIVQFDPASQQPQRVFTGDTLFIGDVGRPDLVGSKGFTSEQMAAMLFESLHDKLLKLDDKVEVFPAHGAGSMCGRNISKETSSTIGEQRRFNYALKPMNKAAFVKLMTTDLPEAPQYFPKDAEINRTGATPLSELPPPASLTPAEVGKLAQQGAVVLDVRTATAFATGHVPGSINIGLGGQFASWAGTLIPIGTPMALVADEIAQVEEAVTRLARVGEESVKGYLSGGLLAWSNAGFDVASLPQITVDELHHRLEEKTEQTDFQIVDVRRAGEFNGGHVPGAIHVALADLEKNLGRIDPARQTMVICQGGYRSIAAASILQRHGFNNLIDVVGGTGAWINAGYPVETVESTTA